MYYCWSLVPCVTSSLTTSVSSRMSGVLLLPPDWLILQQVKVKFLLVPPVQHQAEDQEEGEGDDEDPGPDHGEHDWRAPWLATLRSGVGMTRPSSTILLSVSKSEEAGVAAGVRTLPLLQSTVTLLTLLHH